MTPTQALTDIAAAVDPELTAPDMVLFDRWWWMGAVAGLLTSELVRLFAGHAGVGPAGTTAWKAGVGVAAFAFVAALRGRRARLRRAIVNAVGIFILVEVIGWSKAALWP